MESEYVEEGRNGQDEYAVEFNQNEENGEQYEKHNEHHQHLHEEHHHHEEEPHHFHEKHGRGGGDHENEFEGGHDRRGHFEAGDDGEDGADDDKKLFVGGLTWDTTDKDLSEYFCQFGHVVKAELKVDQISGRSRGFAFVTFKDGDAKKKVAAVREHKLNGKRIDPKAAKPRGKDPVRKVFVGGIDHHIKDEDIKDHFEQNFGPVTDIERPRNKKFCFITFEKEEHAKAAMANSKQNICDCTCDVNEATPKEDHRGGPPGGRGGRGGGPGGHWGPPGGGYNDGYNGPGPFGPPPRGGPRGGHRGHRGGRGGGPPPGWNNHGYDNEYNYDYNQAPDYNYDYNQQPGYDANNSWNNYNYDYYNNYYNYDPNYYANWYGQNYDQSQQGGDWNAYWNSQQYYNDYYKNYYAQQGQDQSQQQQPPPDPSQAPAAPTNDGGNYQQKSRGRGRYHPYQQQGE